MGYDFSGVKTGSPYLLPKTHMSLRCPKHRGKCSQSPYSRSTLVVYKWGKNESPRVTQISVKVPTHLYTTYVQILFSFHLLLFFVFFINRFYQKKNNFLKKTSRHSSKIYKKNLTIKIFF
jgi:hypothetical protein